MSEKPLFTERDFWILTPLTCTWICSIANAKMREWIAREHAPVVEENRFFREFLINVNKRVIPGHTDTIDEAVKRVRGLVEENERLKADLENNIREKEEIVNNQDESRWAFWRKRAGELNDTRLQLEARIAKLEARREIRALRKVIDLAKEYHSEWDNPVPDAIQKKNCRDRLFRALADIEKEFAGE